MLESDTGKNPEGKNGVKTQICSWWGSDKDESPEFSTFIKDWTRYFLSLHSYLIFQDLMILVTIIVIPDISLKLNVYIFLH